jgi:hypothetical protein
LIDKELPTIVDLGSPRSAEAIYKGGDARIMPSPDPRLMELSRIFSGIKFFLARGIPTTTIEHLRELLIERGGLESEHMKDATHVISPSDCFIGDDEAKKAVIVTVRQYYSYLLCKQLTT